MEIAWRQRECGGKDIVVDVQVPIHKYMPLLRAIVVRVGWSLAADCFCWGLMRR